MQYNWHDFYFSYRTKNAIRFLHCFYKIDALQFFFILTLFLHLKPALFTVYGTLQSFIVTEIIKCVLCRPSSDVLI